MERNIDINLLVPKFKVDEKTGVVKCTQSVTLRLFKEVKFFYGKGESDRMKGNVFNKSFGQGMAYARAVQDVMRKVEVGFIKYSFDHLLEVDDGFDLLRDIMGVR